MKYTLKIDIYDVRDLFSNSSEIVTSRSWEVDGGLHRLNGPAFERSDGHEEWYYGGYYVPDEDDKD